MRKVIAAIISLVILMSLLGPAACRTAERPRGKLRVTTTFLVLYIFAKNVAGDAADVDNLVPPGVGTHDYQLTPSDVRKVAEADVIIKNGLGAERWLEPLLESAANQDLTVIDTSIGIPLLKTGEKIPITITSPSQRLQIESGAGGADVHIWLDPIRAVKQVENIRDGLARVDPNNRTKYYRNAAAYIRRLSNLDTEIEERVSRFGTKDFIAFHTAFTYFADRYGLTQVAAIETVPGKIPNPQQLAAIARLVENKRLKALYTEPQYSPRVIDALASDLKIDVFALDPIETGELKQDYYETVMRRNLNALAVGSE